ncbi:L-rhamnose mutarotase [Fibrella forsythiae]|uniref:Right-handed parallel beta-helix repeat-containing protein n=1 Tax=Fibrella forsythiae TaxID=2817061 RepID=A0ABS3JD32_9BACT|nr:L-rhamnose mutarotase [Fibrella forsythiae]MBO0947902.1 right-handed parallel beta-helix repeat-containing protein [Fibrella forsythiae]
MNRTLATLLLLLLGTVTVAQQAQCWVAVDGSDANAGTKEKPLASLQMALRKVRELRRLADPSIAGGAHIYLRNGLYLLNEPVFIRPEDSGTLANPTIIESAPDERPVLSGGVPVAGWQKLKGTVPGLPNEAIGNVWVADAPMAGGRLLTFRQLWVNGQKATRAKDTPYPLMNRILSWNRAEQTCWIPAPKAGDLSKAAGLEMLIHQWWAIANLRVKHIDIRGDSAKLSFHQPESRIQSEHPWPAPWLSKETGNSAFYLANAIQFLNEPGEWFLDTKAQKLYYIPRPGENLATSTVIAPSLETLVQITGTPDHPVSNVQFRGIAFQHTGWVRPSQQGHVPHQVGLYMLDAYKLKTPGTPDKKTLENQAWVGRPAAAVEVSFANHTGFSNCRFTHLASTGLDYHRGVQDNQIQGNVFSDIGGTGIQAGVFSDEATEIHLPYNPTDERDVCSNLTIRNNLITNVTNEDWGCVGIGAGYVRGIAIEHNDISNVSYSGISMGWGWTPTVNVMRNNRVVANRIHHFAKHLYDAAAIYTLSAQPGSIIAGNVIDSVYNAPYAHLPAHWFYLYTDEGSSFFTVRDNWTPSEKYLQNANGPNNVWANNGPQVADSLKAKAGLEPSYGHLLGDKTAPDPAWRINKENPVIVELVAKPGHPLDLQQMKAVLAKSKVSEASLYQWDNHYVIFDKVQDVFVLSERLKTAFPTAQVKTYYDLFFEFNRSRCSTGPVTGEWNHTILTANLVADPARQHEYLAHHATQFEKWPELSNGFCNADFQQLLLYRNGRQLMLVISIPKGESLDKLNPKTTENNPRVDEWNALMKKYQEGIPGTKPGETWVNLKPVN